MGGSRPPRPGAHRSPAAPTGSAPRPPTPSTPPAPRTSVASTMVLWLFVLATEERITAGAPEERRARGEPPSAGRKPSEAAGLPRRFAGRQRRPQHSGECCGPAPAAARSPRRAEAHSSHVTPAPSPLHATPSGAPPFARRRRVGSRLDGRTRPQQPLQPLALVRLADSAVGASPTGPGGRPCDTSAGSRLPGAAPGTGS